jgi:hypothetical protein
MADSVAKPFSASKRATLIQDQALMRNVDSKSQSLQFVCCAFLFYSPLRRQHVCSTSAIGAISDDKCSLGVFRTLTHLGHCAPRGVQGTVALPRFRSGRALLTNASIRRLRKRAAEDGMVWRTAVSLGARYWHIKA